MKLHEIAHSRAGDKGNIASISVIAYKEEDYPKLCEVVTGAKVFARFKPLGATKVERYEIPTLCALNFVIHDVLGGGVTRSLALDTHGKSLSGLMLDIDL